MARLAIGVGLAVIFLVAGDFLQKRGAAEVKAVALSSFGGARGLLRPANLLRFLREARVFNAKILLSIACLAVHFAGYLVALHAANVTLVVPLLSLATIVSTVVGRYALHEDVTIGRWIGVGLIVGGVALILLFHGPSPGTGA